MKKSNFNAYLESFEKQMTEETVPVEVAPPTQTIELTPQQQTDMVYGSEWQKTDLLTSLAKNGKEEQSAIEHYTQLLGQLIHMPESPLKQELTAKIKEIISDEMEHAEALQTFYSKVSEIVAAEG